MATMRETADGRFTVTILGVDIASCARRDAAERMVDLVNKGLRWPNGSVPMAA